MTRTRIEGKLDNKTTQLWSYLSQRKSNTALKVVAFITIAGLIGFGVVGAFVLPSLPIRHAGAIACMATGGSSIFLYGIVKTVKKTNQKKLEQKSHEKTNDTVSEIEKRVKQNDLEPFKIYSYQQANKLYTFFYSKKMSNEPTKYIYVENCLFKEGTKELINKLDQLTRQSIGAFACSKKLEDLQLYKFRQENQSVYTFFYRDPADGNYYFIDDCGSDEPLNLLKARLTAVSAVSSIEAIFLEEESSEEAGSQTKDGHLNVTVQRAVPIKGDSRIESIKLCHALGFTLTQASAYLL